jgi:hypothetical protein
MKNITTINAENNTVGFEWSPPLELIDPDLMGSRFILIMGDDRGAVSGGAIQGNMPTTSYLCGFPMSGVYQTWQRRPLYGVLVLAILGLLVEPFPGRAKGSDRDIFVIIREYLTCLARKSFFVSRLLLQLILSGIFKVRLWRY